MKKILTLFLFSGSLLWAVEESPRKDKPQGMYGPRGEEPPIEEIQAIRKILELPPERLSRLRATIQQVERLSPDDRKDIAQRLEALEKASPQERRQGLKEIRERLMRASMGARVLEYHLKKLSPDEAKQEREAFQKLSPEEKKKKIRGLIEKYGPELEELRKKRREKESSEPGAPPPRPPQEEMPEPMPLPAEA